MKKLIYLVCIFTVVFSCKTTNTGLGKISTLQQELIGTTDSKLSILEGKISAVPDGFGIPEATLFLTSGRHEYTAKSQEKGFFRFLRVPAGNYKIQTDYPGFYSLQDSIEVYPGQIISISIGMVYDE